MKRTFVLIMLMFSFCLIFGQVEKISISLNGVDTKSGSKVLLNGIFKREIEGTARWQAFIISESGVNYVDLNNLKKYNFKFNNLQEFWKLESLINEGYLNISRYGFQYKQRKEWEEEALQYINELEENNLIYKDDNINYYVNEIINKIYPTPINDGRPGFVNVKVMVDHNPNTYMLINGTLIVTTGLLSTLRTEDELTGIFAHEIAHFILDHESLNINKIIARQKAAEFWAAFATTLVAATETYVSYKNPYYIPGGFTMASAIVSNKIASAFIDRLGLQYSLDQEQAADRCAVGLLKYFKADTLSLSYALIKIRDYYSNCGNLYELSGDGSYANISQRILPARDTVFPVSTVYERQIASVIRNSAVIEFNSNHFLTCISLVDRNISNGIPTEDDYLLKLMSNLSLYNNPEKNMENLDLINKAKALNINPTINLAKQDALVLLRLKKYTESKVALEAYKENLVKEIDRQEKNQFFSGIQYLENELKWAKELIVNTKGL